MMQEIRNRMLLAAQMAASGRASTRVGRITSFDPGNYAAVVQLFPSGESTGWLPVVSPWVGNGWGLFAPPTPGDVVEVQFVDDNIEAGFVCGRFYNDTDRPLTVQSGEFWLVHKSGSLLKFHNDGSVELASNAAMTITAAGGLSINANVAITGTLTNNGKNVGSTHTHGGVAPGGSQTAVPT